ncbi:small ribosomal subunit protein mS23 isoform X2 [Melospiza melodia melodia]|uniref:small ribosomal subunit protein mS23 isoform X2 n=1 Tax=Melospiza melodia melodia TaxID=1914991 RepID=UPI002FD4F3AF
MAATAGSRTQKIGSVFSRTRNLVRIGLLRKPLWLDVYAAFPPLREPVYRVPRPRYGSGDPIAAVLYREDTVRAQGARASPECKTATLLPRFVEKYNELKEEGKIEEEKLFEETGKALLASGILLQRRGVDRGAAPRDAASQPQLQDKRKDGQEQPPELAGTQKDSPCPS